MKHSAAGVRGDFSFLLSGWAWWGARKGLGLGWDPSGWEQRIGACPDVLVLRSGQREWGQRPVVAAWKEVQD